MFPEFYVYITDRKTCVLRQIIIASKAIRLKEKDHLRLVASWAQKNGT